MFGFLSFIHYHPPSISLSLVFLDLRPRIKQGRSERMVHGFGLVWFDLVWFGAKSQRD